MYIVNYWLIKLKNQPADLEKYTIHIVSPTQEEARRVAEERFGSENIDGDPVLDNPQ